MSTTEAEIAEYDALLSSVLLDPEHALVQPPLPQQQQQLLELLGAPPISPAASTPATSFPESAWSFSNAFDFGLDPDLAHMVLGSLGQPPSLPLHASMPMPMSGFQSLSEPLFDSLFPSTALAPATLPPSLLSLGTLTSGPLSPGSPPTQFPSPSQFPTPNLNSDDLMAFFPIKEEPVDDAKPPFENLPQLFALTLDSASPTPLLPVGNCGDSPKSRSASRGLSLTIHPSETYPVPPISPATTAAGTSPALSLSPSPDPSSSSSSRTPIVHSGYECEHEGCGLVFATKEKRKSHRRIHKRTRAFPCPHEGCTHVPFRKQDLERHLLTHLEVGTFVCDRCQRRFKRKDGLGRHQKAGCMKQQ